MQVYRDSGASDEILVGRLCAKDVNALEILYARYSRPIYALAVRLVGDAHVAEDIVQECFLKLWRQPELYAPEKGRVTPWLLGMAHHRAIDWLRRRTIERRHEAEGVDPVEHSAVGGDPESILAGALRRDEVSQALAKLPDAQRVALELAYLRGMTQTQIADFLGEPLGTIKTRTRLAMRKLRTVLEPFALEESL
ncbi:MAG: RNA polymerase sigma factor [Chloroflexota bacterium]